MKQYVSNDIKLPPAFNSIMEIIGPKAALAIADKYAGQRIYIPSVAKKNHTLCEVIDFKTLQILSNYYGNGWINIPNVVARYLKHQIAKDPALSLKEAAAATGFTFRYISILRNNDDNKPTLQNDLFKKGE